MLEIIIPKHTGFDEATDSFFVVGPFKLQLEHSLLSISKWEGITHKAFLGKKPKTAEDTIEYIRCMTISPNVKPEAYLYLTDKNILEITEYINKSMTASIIPKRSGPESRDVITAELIYYWMITLNIPFECQKWHLDRLLTLIQVCNLKNNSGKKMSSAETMARNNAINKARRAQYNTKG